jgi:hypothetical protein
MGFATFNSLASALLMADCLNAPTDAPDKLVEEDRASGVEAEAAGSIRLIIPIREASPARADASMEFVGAETSGESGSELRAAFCPFTPAVIQTIASALRASERILFIRRRNFPG